MISALYADGHVSASRAAPQHSNRPVSFPVRETVSRESGTGGLVRYTLGGLPRFFFTGAPSDGPVVADAAPDFLFLLPLGRPRPLLAGCASLGVVAANEATHKFWKNDKHGRSQMLSRADDQSSPSGSSVFG